jgi:hypothetical protein
MIDQPNLERFEQTGDPPCGGDVVVARFAASRGVIVRQDHGVGAEFERPAHERTPGQVDAARIAVGDDLVGQVPVRGVEKGHVQTLVRQVRQNAPEIEMEEIVVRAHRLAGQFLQRRRFGELFGRQNLNQNPPIGIPERRELIRRGVDRPAERPEAADQPFGDSLALPVCERRKELRQDG